MANGKTSRSESAGTAKQRRNAADRQDAKVKRQQSKLQPSTNEERDEDKPT